MGYPQVLRISTSDEAGRRRPNWQWFKQDNAVLFTSVAWCWASAGCAAYSISLEVDEEERRGMFVVFGGVEGKNPELGFECHSHQT